MTITQLEERLSVLEQTVARLQKQVEHRQSSSDLPQTEDDIIEGAAYDLTPELIPKVTYHVRAKIVKIEKVTLGLGLSPEEWASLPLDLEEDDDK